MQKLINALAVVSFVGVAGIIGGGAYVYTQRDALIENAKEKITKAATEAIAGALPGLIDAAMPELPGVTGGAIPMGEDKGGSVPGMRLP
jgi:hypothetical protein|tara:strand:+ start:1344 stop:1610 length:267 start_codon:yes stop_codon:yes gene_type:complete